MRYYNFEIGRSLMEMMATLAIYGIITITGITGFRYLINKHTANAILSEAQMHAALLAGNALSNGLPESTSLNNMSHQFTYKRESEVAYSLNLSGIDKSVCKLLWGTRDLGWAETVLLNNGADCTEENTLSIYINTGMTPKTTDEKRITACESDNDCGECGTCSAEQKVCVYSDSLCPNSDKSYCNKGTCQACEVGEFKATNGTCYQCSDGTQRTATQEECHACSGRVWTGLTSNNCQSCSLQKFKISQTTDNFSPYEECARCANRTVLSDGHPSNGNIYCAKNCPDGFLDANGNCANCQSQEVRQGWHAGGEADPFQQIVAACAACPTLLPQFGNTSCVQCDSDLQAVVIYQSSIEDAEAQCNKCSNRVFIASYPKISYGPVFRCAKPCSANKFLDASGGCRNCSSPQITLPISSMSEFYGHRNEITQHVQDCGNFVQYANTFYNYAVDISDETIKVSSSQCQTYWKGRRYVSATDSCTLCPSDISGLTAEQQAQCTP